MKRTPMYERFMKNRFLLEELVLRDFKQKYKRTLLGVFWSILSPLLSLAIMSFVFGRFFSGTIPNYTIYLFCGTLLMSYYREATYGGMQSLVFNANIITKINIPKHLFLLSKNVSVIINFLINLCVFFVFCAIFNVQFSIKFLMLIFPILCLLLLNIGVGLVLSALFVFFSDITYIYDLFLMMLNYVSAIFYTVDTFPTLKQLFLFNPLYCYITYFRSIVLYNTIPSLMFHGICLLHALVFLAIGYYIYKKNDNRFLYYL